MKSLLLRIVHTAFKIRPMESFLIWWIQRTKKRNVIIKLAPPNTFYTERDVRYCKRFGIEFKLNLNDYQSWVLYFFSENDSSFGSLKYLKEGDVVIDVGGNIGQTALMMAERIGGSGKVYSFEPFTKTYKRFKENLSLNPSIYNITLEHLALGEKAEKLTMYVENAKNSGGNRIKPAGKKVSTQIEEVVVTTLDEYSKTNAISKINLIKIDVEGFEMKVLEGSQTTIREFKPALFIEANDANLEAQGASLKAMSDFLKRNGYTIFNAENNMELNLGWENNFKGSDIYCKIV
ncbi:MAG: FkbM family methyltransferase [Bacteroidota bacterium]|nr:FkbM family methyltransferase [Bacteroidota bacterium]